MTTMESYEEVRSQTPENLTGIEVLNNWHDIHGPNSSLVNSAMLMEVALRNTKNAVATGRDASILGTPSQELLTDLILDMPIGIHEPSASGQQLFQELVAEAGGSETRMAEELTQFLRYVQDATSPYSNMGYQERMEMSLNVDYYVLGLQYTAQKLVNKALDKRGRWGHEGGDISDLHPEIYQKFVDREYIEFMINRYDRNERPGLTRQVALRMLHEAEWLYFMNQGAHKTL